MVVAPSYHRKKMFLSDHFHVYSVLTFCLASGKKKAACLLGVYLSVAGKQCKLFSC